MKRTILQGEVYVCDLSNDAVGSEQKGKRPCVVIQLDILNRTSSNVIIVPITSRPKKKLPTHIILDKENYDFLFYKYNTVLCENIRSISKDRLGKLIGRITDSDLKKILKAKDYAFIEL